MLIKYSEQVINLNNVITFFKNVDRLEIHCCNGDTIVLTFSDEKKLDKAFEEIWKDYNWQRQVCNLDK
jgi:hypothetical protein